MSLPAAFASGRPAGMVIGKNSRWGLRRITSHVSTTKNSLYLGQVGSRISVVRQLQTGHRGGHPGLACMLGEVLSEMNSRIMRWNDGEIFEDGSSLQLARTLLTN